MAQEWSIGPEEDDEDLEDYGEYNWVNTDINGDEVEDGESTQTNMD